MGSDAELLILTDIHASIGRRFVRQIVIDRVNKDFARFALLPNINFKKVGEMVTFKLLTIRPN